jgi:hypothetical protein
MIVVQSQPMQNIGKIFLTNKLGMVEYIYNPSYEAVVRKIMI